MLPTHSQDPRASLKSLLQQSKALSSHIITDSALPLLDKSLDLVSHSSLALRNRLGVDTSVGTTATLDPKSTYLLSQQGFDPQKLQSSLASISIASTFEPLEPVLDTDLNAFLRNEHDTMITCAIQETRLANIRDSEAAFESRLQRDWESRKRAVFEELGSHKPSCKF